jgi:hypothetical protein
MDVLDEGPRFSIKPTKDEPRCTDAQGATWSTPFPIQLSSGAAALVSVFLPQRERHCACCGQVVQS